MKKLALDFGHGVNYDRGANGIKFEDDMIDETGEILLELLQDKFEIVLTRPSSATSTSDSLRKRCNTANRYGADLFVSMHFNAFNRQANGTEIFYISSAGKNIAAPIQQEIVKLGFVNRGIKFSDRLFVLKATAMPAVLIESCFCDSERDMNLYDPVKLAQAISTGLI